MKSQVVLVTLLTWASFSAGSASASCIVPALTAEAISAFKANPGAMVAPNSDARIIETQTRDLAGTDASLSTDLVQVARGTIPRFRTAIAAGLAQAAITCGNVNQEAAVVIQEAVANFEDGEFQASFAAVAGDLSTAATEAAQASAASSAGSVIVINPNSGGTGNLTPGGGGGGGNAAIGNLSITANAFGAMNITAGAARATAPISVSPSR